MRALAAASVAALALVGLVAPAASSAPPTPAYTYSHAWGSATLAPAFPSGLCLWGRAYLADRDNNRIRIENLKTGYVTSVGTEGAGPGQFQNPMDVVANIYGMFVADTGNDRVQSLTNDGTLRQTLGPAAPGGLDRPTSLALAYDSKLYVVDSGHARVVVFKSDGTFVREIGGSDAGVPTDGRFHEPTGIAVAWDGTFYVVDRFNDNVQHFTFAGEHLGTWGGHGSGPGQFDGPQSVVVDDEGLVYVTESGHARVQVFSPEGDYLAVIAPPAGTPGWIGAATDVGVDADGSVHVVDGGRNRVSVFDPVRVPWTPPTLSGVPTVGSVLTATLGEWPTGRYSSVRVEWLRDGVPITSLSPWALQYTVTPYDAGIQISTRVTASFGALGSGTASTEPLTVPKADVTVTATLVQPTVAAGARPELIVWIREGRGFSPSGMVTIKMGATTVKTVTSTSLLGGAFIVALPAQGVGKYGLTAVYSGDQRKRGATSSVATLTVVKAKPSVSIALSREAGWKHTPRSGERLGYVSVKVRVHVRATGMAAPTGKVVIRVGGKARKTVALHSADKGVIRVTLRFQARGGYKISAFYKGSRQITSKVSGYRKFYVF